MESLARRGVRTTVAVAGLAALGVGLATPAFAAPNFPEVSGVGNNSTTAATDQQAGSSSEFTKASDALTKLPGKFNFEMPKANSTTVPSDQAPSDTTPAPDATTTPEAATTPSTDPTSALPVGVPNVQVTPCRTSTLAARSTRQAASAEGRARKQVL
jgi:hypothetical protein